MRYSVYLNNLRIGYSLLEFADPPMGVVFGKLLLDNIQSGYGYFKSYCQQNGEELVYDDEVEKSLTTTCISALQVCLADGSVIKSEIGTYIEGMDDDGFYVFVLGVPYPFFKEAFPQHANL